MPRTLDPPAAQALISRAVTAVAGEQTAKKISPAVDAVMTLARQSVAIGAGGRHKPIVTSIRTTLTGTSSDGGSPVTVIYDKRNPIDAGPKRQPIRVGGGTCVSFEVTHADGTKGTLTICIEWVSS